MRWVHKFISSPVEVTGKFHLQGFHRLFTVFKPITKKVLQKFFRTALRKNIIIKLVPVCGMSVVI